MNAKYIDGIWQLFRKKYPDTYSFSAINPEFICKEPGQVDFPAVHFSKGGVTAYQSHSGRSAWIYKPWKDGRGWYAGFEYKGVGLSGGRIKRFAGTAWGGAYKDSAIIEHRFSKTAFDAGVFCQRPVAIYDYGKFNGKPIAVVVRTFLSPLRLSDFLFDRRFYNRYLELRKESDKEYCESIAGILGKNVRKLLDLGIYHGTMGINNITSEGEIADFEPTSGGTWEGLMDNREPYFQYIAISRVLNAGKTAFPKYRRDFNSRFAESFFGKRMELTTSKPALEIAERYCGKEIDTGKEVGKKTPAEIKKLITLVKSAQKEAKTAMDRKIYDYVLKTLTNPPE